MGLPHCLLFVQMIFESFTLPQGQLAFGTAACCLAVHMKDEQRFEMQPEIVG